MSKRAFLALTVLVLASFAPSSGSWAGFEVCNESSQRVDVALGYRHGQFGWTSEGWWTLQTDQCRTIMHGDLSSQHYYLYATGSRGAVWQAQGGQEGRSFCIQSKRFVLQNRNFRKNGETDCESYNLKRKQFLVVDTEGASNHIHHLRD